MSPCRDESHRSAAPCLRIQAVDERRWSQVALALLPTSICSRAASAAGGLPDLVDVRTRVARAWQAERLGLVLDGGLVGVSSAEGSVSGSGFEPGFARSLCLLSIREDGAVYVLHEVRRHPVELFAVIPRGYEDPERDPEDEPEAARGPCSG